MSTIKVTMSFIEAKIFIKIMLNAFHLRDSLNTRKTLMALNAVKAPPKPSALAIISTARSNIEIHTIKASNILNLSREYSTTPKPRILISISIKPCLVTNNQKDKKVLKDIKT